MEKAIDHMAQSLKDQFNEVPEEIRHGVSEYKAEAETADDKWKITMSIEPIST
jgi:hypothetical protein